MLEGFLKKKILKLLLDLVRLNICFFHLILFSMLLLTHVYKICESVHQSLQNPHYKIHLRKVQNLV